MGWTVQGSKPAEGEVFRSGQTGLEANPTSCTMRKRVLPGKKNGRNVVLITYFLLVRVASALQPVQARYGV